MLSIFGKLINFQNSPNQSEQTLESAGKAAGGSASVAGGSGGVATGTGDISWDSVSQTSSTSGYRDNNSLQTGLLSPDGSLSGMVQHVPRSLSQHSLLMLFETQDEEDTLI